MAGRLAGGWRASAAQKYSLVDLHVLPAGQVMSMGPSRMEAVEWVGVAVVKAVCVLVWLHHLYHRTMSLMVLNRLRSHELQSDI